MNCVIILTEVKTLPSAKVLEQNKQIVADLSERIKASCTGLLVTYEGINVADDTKLRKELREAGVNYTVVKNTFLTRAFAETGLSDLDQYLEGTTAFATCDEDYVAAARILCGFADKSKKGFAVKGGYMDGEVISMDKIVELAKLPSREVLLANVLGAFQAPIASFARAIQAVVDKGGVEACAPAEEAAPAAETAEAPETDAPATEAAE